MPAVIGGTHGSLPRGGSRGFSLIAVLVVAIIGLAIVGATVSVTISSGGAGRETSAATTRYNFLQDAVEEGKAQLKKALDNDHAVPRHDGYNAASHPTIDAIDKLLVNYDFGLGSGKKGFVKERDINRSELGRLGIAGNSGKLVVKIYDMQYPPDKLAPVGSGSGNIPIGDFNKMYPSITLKAGSPWNAGESEKPEEKPLYATASSGTDSGVYLIRASLAVGEHESILDTAIIQANSKP